jgi:hypothetical protein
MSGSQFQVLSAPTESCAQRARRLQAEARAAAVEHIEMLEKTLAQVAQLAAEIGVGGDAYPPGARDLAARLTGDAAWCAQTFDAILRHLGERRFMGESAREAQGGEEAEPGRSH